MNFSRTSSVGSLHISPGMITLAKMKRTLLLLLFAAVSVSGFTKKPSYDVYLLIGQSNMAGRGEILESDRVPIEGVWMLGANDEIIPACEPLNLYSTIRKDAVWQGYNLGDSFARKLHKRTRRPILLVVNARGGTSIQQWMKGAPKENIGEDFLSFYDEAVRRTRIAQKYGRLKGIIWHQGESDTSPDNLAVYLENLSVFVADLRSDLGVDESVPFVVGEVNYASSHTAINPVLNKAAETIPNAWCASAEECGVNNDNLHFSREGLIRLGEKYADRILRSVYHRKGK